MHFQTRLLPDKLDLAQLCHTQPDHYPYALISTVSVNSTNSRYDIYFAYPQESLTLDHNNMLSSSAGLNLEKNTGFLDSLDKWWKSLFLPPETSSKNDLPFTGGWFVFLSYELVSEIEPCLQLPVAQKNIPIALAVRCPAAIIIDRQEGKTYAVAETGYAYLLDNIESDCKTLTSSADDNQLKNSVQATSVTEADTDPYLEQVARIKQYIRDGDIFQANLSRPWSVEIEPSVADVDIFRYLSKSNPGSFAALIKTDKATIISSSPERLVQSRNKRVETRPIAGTRPRSSEDKTDTALANELLAHPKEQAEHIMLIDLERNDLGRICIPGSMQVNELMTLESYQHVHHIVSNVQGEIRDDVTPADIIRAVFPGGTITGCPKIRCMEILAEMENESRGAYTGSAGYINRDGSLDFNILIRTMVRDGNKITFRAGGGIVADSDPQHELEETRAKAKGLLRVFEKQAEPCNA
jgi:anthranilate synthase component 1